MIKQDKIFTPHVSDGALGGITRRLMFDLAREMGREISEANLTRYDLFVADEIFATGTGAEVVPISEVDGRKIGAGPRGPHHRGVHPPLQGADAKYGRFHLLILYYIAGSAPKRRDLNNL